MEFDIPRSTMQRGVTVDLNVQTHQPVLTKDRKEMD